jgi:hypothetical protein
MPHFGDPEAATYSPGRDHESSDNRYSTPSDDLEDNRWPKGTRGTLCGVQLDNIPALSENVGAAVTSRAHGFDDLRARLGTATTTKEVADLSARLQLETARMANYNLRLQAITMQQETHPPQNTRDQSRWSKREHLEFQIIMTRNIAMFDQTNYQIGRAPKFVEA